MLMSASVKKMYCDHINFQPQHLSTVITGPAVEPASATVASSSSSPSSTSVPIGTATQEYVVKLRGVPWDANDQDIVRFIEPVCRISTSDVHILTNFEVRKRSWNLSNSWAVIYCCYSSRGCFVYR